MTEDLEAIRRSYLPDRIRILLLGESPPPRRGFFYLGTSTLYRHTVPVFVSEYGFPDDPKGFLKRFSAAGFYLDDFSSKRGDHPHEKPDSPDVQTAIDRIGELIAEHEPVAVIGVLKRIEALVQRSIESSGRRMTPQRSLRFPHHSNDQAQQLYADGLRSVLAEFG